MPWTHGFQYLNSQILDDFRVPLLLETLIRTLRCTALHCLDPRIYIIHIYIYTYIHVDPSTSCGRYLTSHPPGLPIPVRRSWWPKKAFLLCSIQVMGMGYTSLPHNIYIYYIYTHITSGIYTCHYVHLLSQYMFLCISKSLSRAYSAYIYMI